MILSQTQRDQLYAQMRADAPNETCGFIGGKNARAEKIYPIPNAAAKRITNFLMDANAQLAALQDMDANDYDILAIYHSHPNSAPSPSETDLRDAWSASLQEPYYPNTLYLILSMRHLDAPEMRAYHLHNQEWIETPIVIETIE